ncbi:MAG: hypothetical protein FJ034_05200, partial [Chloroflexi bacterium]|nr:hypothetical protein [Chloroflexota bacterium]
MTFSFGVRVGASPATAPDAILAVEPETGAILRTKGRLYVLCEVQPSIESAGGLAKEVADTVRHQYYEDLSAGVEISVRRAARQADRRAAQRLRELRGRVTLHLAAVAIVNNALYAVRVGAAQVFLVRRARLFLPGDEPDDLADFVHRTTTRRAASLGVEPDLLPAVWRQTVEHGDTVIVSSGALVDGIGAEELKKAAITLHPAAAAEHVRNRAVADHVSGSATAMFIEVAAASAGTTRVIPTPEVTQTPAEVVVAETIRMRLESVASRLPAVGAFAERAVARVVDAARSIAATVLELLPRRATALPRSPELARKRSEQRRQAASVAAVLLIAGSLALGTAAYGDYNRSRAVSEYAAAVAGVRADVAEA